MACGIENFIQLMRVIENFAEVSRLKANPSKSSIYFGGVAMEIQERVLTEYGLVRGELPFRYLGVPLSSKKLPISQYQGLLNKVLGKINCWTSKLLSYAGRIQLIKSVLFGVQAYWSQIFLLPKKVLKAIETSCRIFLWTEKSSFSRRALVAWEHLCLPKAAGGWNVAHLITWNQAAICKLLWNLAQKRDKLWVKWVHGYYIKNQNILTMQEPPQASWMVRKIFKAKEIIACTQTKELILQQTSFHIQQVYYELRGEVQLVQWKKMLCCNIAPPKFVFVSWLVILRRLTTCDFLRKINIQVDQTCILCKNKEETIDHLFFECEFSAAIWRTVSKWSGHPRTAQRWEDEFRYMITQSKTKSNKQRMYRLMVSTVLYHVWKERNQRRFQGKEKEIGQIIREVKIHIATICQGYPKLLQMIEN